MNHEKRMLDGENLNETVMIGSQKLAVGEGPGAVWWREVEHAEQSSVMFWSLSGAPGDGQPRVLDTGLVGDTDLALGAHGRAFVVWGKATPRGAARIYGCDPLSLQPEIVELSAPGAGSPCVALDATGKGLAVWSRIEGKEQHVECAAASGGGSVTRLSGGSWSSRPCICAAADGLFFVAWDELSPEGGSVQACLVDAAGKKVQDVTIFPREKTALRFLNPRCAGQEGRVLVLAVRTEDVVSGFGVVDQRHEVAFASVDVASGGATRFDSPARLNHGLLSDQELQTNLWGYLGKRLNPLVLPTGRVFWERKQHHDGYTDTERARGVLCFKDSDPESGGWSAEKILHKGSFAYQVGPAAGGTWVLHRPVIHDRTHQLVLERVDASEEAPSEHDWLDPPGYEPVMLPLQQKDEEQRTEVSGEAIELFWGDTHVHSNISIDPEGEPDELLHYARDLARLDFVALTDNDSLYTSWLRVWDRLYSTELSQAWTEDGRFVAVEGFEYTRPSLGDTPRNHRTCLLRHRGDALFRWSDPVRDDERGRVGGQDHRDVDGLEAEAERIDALLIAHHGDWLVSDSPRDVGIEAISSWDTYIQNPEYVFGAWNSGKKRCLVGGSDGHRRNAGLGGANTGVWAPSLTHSNIVEGIARRRTIATQGRRPFIDFRLSDSAGRTLFIGDDGVLEGGITAHIRVRVEPGFEDRILLVELLHGARMFGNWGLSDTENDGTTLSVDYPLRGRDSIAADQVVKMSGPRYLYLRVRFSGPDHQFPSNVAPARGPWAWTTPIWWR